MQGFNKLYLDTAPYINDNGFVLREFKFVDSGADTSVHQEYMPSFQLAPIELYVNDKANLNFLKVRIDTYTKKYGGLPLMVVVPAYQGKSKNRGSSRGTHRWTITDYIEQVPGIYTRGGDVLGVECNVLDFMEEL